MQTPKGMRFPLDVVLVCVRWHAIHSLSVRHLEDMMRARGVYVDHSTINRWVLRFLPTLDMGTQPNPTGARGGWRLDETYIKVKGVWHYVYRALDDQGTTLDFLLTARRNKAAALRFFAQARSVVPVSHAHDGIDPDARSAVPASRPMLRLQLFRAPKDRRGASLGLVLMVRKGQRVPRGVGEPPARSRSMQEQSPGVHQATGPLPLLPAPSKKRATLARLLKEARQAFSDKGLAGARIDDIARAAGVTKQLVYHYFSTKEQLFASVLDASAQDLLADLLALELDHLPPTQALRALLEHSFDQYRSDPNLGALAQESFRLHEHNAAHPNRFTGLAPTLLHLMDRVLRRGAASGEFVQGVNARMFCAASAVLTTGGFTSRYVASTVAGFDTTAPEGISAWRKYSIDFSLATVLASKQV